MVGSIQYVSNLSYIVADKDSGKRKYCKCNYVLWIDFLFVKKGLLYGYKKTIKKYGQYYRIALIEGDFSDIDKKMEAALMNW